MMAPLDDFHGYKPRRGWKKWIALLLAATLAFWVIHLWFGGATKERGPMASPVHVAQVTRKDVPVYLDGLGTVQAYNTVTVRTQVDGQLIKVLFHEGQEVKAGDALAKIDPRTFQTGYDQALAAKSRDEAQLANAKLDLTRYERLGDAVARQVLDTQAATVRQLEATILADQAAIENTRTQLSYTTITAPFSGRTGIRQVDVGNIVHPADTNGIVVLTQLTPISVVFSLPQQQVLPINEAIAAQGKLKVLATSSDTHTLIDEGKLELVDNEIDQTTGTVRLKATFPNQKHLLWPGAFVNARLLLETRKNALVVPTVAVQQGPQGAYVFVLKDDNTVSIRPVKVAFAEGLNSLIDEGLNEGEYVVTDGMAKLQEGSKVSHCDTDDACQRANDGKETSHHSSSIRRKAP